MTNYNAERCDPEVYEHGTLVLMTHGPSREIEAWVIKVREDSGQKVDWNYVGGRALIAVVGDVARVQASIKKFEADLVEIHRAEWKRLDMASRGGWCVATGYNGTDNIIWPREPETP